MADAFRRGIRHKTPGILFTSQSDERTRGFESLTKEVKMEQQKRSMLDHLYEWIRLISLVVRHAIAEG